MLYIVGQLLGILATIICIILPLFKKKWQMLVGTIVLNALMALNYVLIGQKGSAACLCLTAIVQSIVSLIHVVKETKVKHAEKIGFLILYVGFGIYGYVAALGLSIQITIRSVLEILPIVGSVMNMISVFVRKEQSTRKYLLASAAAWSVYTAAIGSTTFFAEIFALLSTCAAMYHHRQVTVQKEEKIKT